MILIILFLLYLLVGAAVAFVLRRLYLMAAPEESTHYCSNNAEMCVLIGVTWIVAAPFAFAMFFARYGEELKKKRENK